MAGKSGILSKLKVIIPFRAKPKGLSDPATYREASKNSYTPKPDLKLHLKDIFTARQSLDSYALLDRLVASDPDASSALNGYLTVADQEPVLEVLDINGAIDRAGYKIVNQLIEVATSRMDYSKNFKLIKTLRTVAEELRYMMLVRGQIGVEAVMDKFLLLQEFRQIDMKNIRWTESAPNVLVPTQIVSGKVIALDIPTFFTASYRKSPTSNYAQGAFISAVNTIAAREQVINDLYRIMQVTGYPRIDVELLEEVVANNAPADVASDPIKLTNYIATRLNEVSGQFASLRVDEPLIHFDSVKVGMLNEKNPGVGVDVSAIIDVLNAQNQAGLKTMATILGRGNAGVNTATVEARLFALNVESVNRPIGEIMSQILTMVLRFQGSQSRVKLTFPDVDLRSDLEQEANLQLKGLRLKQDLSSGIISDDEYHLKMYGRIRPDSAPELSGTGFMDQGAQPPPTTNKGGSPNTNVVTKKVKKQPGGSAKNGQKP